MRKLLIVVCALFFLYTQVRVVFEVFRPLAYPRWYILGDTININDYFQYYKSAKLAYSDKAHKVYDPETQFEFENELVKPLKSDKVYFSQYPPIIFPLVYPLSLVEYNVGYTLWCIVQAAAGMLSLWLMAASLGPLRRRERIILMMGVMSTIPAYLGLWHGNVVFFMLACFSLYVYGFMNNKNVVGGAAMAISAYKPQYAPIMLIPSFVKWRWKLFAAMIVLDVVLILIAGTIVGWDNIINYPKIVSDAELKSAEFRGVNPHLMVCLRGVLTHFLPYESNFKAAAMIYFVSFVPLLVFWWKLRAVENKQLLLWALALTVVFDLIFCPHVHFHDSILLAIPAALTLPVVSPLQALKLPSVSERIWCLILLLYPVYSWIINSSLHNTERGIEASIFFAVHAVLLTAGVKRFSELFKQSRSAEATVKEAIREGD